MLRLAMNQEAQPLNFQPGRMLEGNVGSLRPVARA